MLQDPCVEVVTPAGSTPHRYSDRFCVCLKSHRWSVAVQGLGFRDAIFKERFIPPPVLQCTSPEFFSGPSEAHFRHPQSPIFPTPTPRKKIGDEDPRGHFWFSVCLHRLFGVQLHANGAHMDLISLSAHPNKPPEEPCLLPSAPSCSPHPQNHASTQS